MINKFFYIPREILDNIPYSVQEKEILLPLVDAYRELKRGNDVGLFEYRISPKGDVIINADNYDVNLKSLYAKCEVVNLCSSNLISLDLLPKRPKDIAKQLHKQLSYNTALSYDDINETVKAITGYKKAVSQTAFEKLINEINNSSQISDQ